MKYIKAIKYKKSYIDIESRFTRFNTEILLQYIIKNKLTISKIIK